MKTLRKFAFLCLFALMLCSLGASAQIVGSPSHLQQTSGMPYQLAGVWKFNSSSTATGGFDVRGISYYRVFYVPVGTLSGCSLSIDSATSTNSTTGALTSPTIGGILAAATIGSCTSPGQYVTTSAAGISAYGQVTPTITGTGSLIVVLYGYSDNPAAGGTSSNSITSPVDGSGYVEIDCKTGCAGGNANGQAAMANSAPVVIASNQSAVPVTGTFYQATQPVSGTVGLSVPTSILAGQQAVTATAAALASNALTRGLCVEALSTNSISVFVGASGVTTSTGIELPAGASYCPALSNSNELYVVASTTGASVTWSGN
jgi:hypothetical protein